MTTQTVKKYAAATKAANARFHSMTASERRVAIAKDVLKQLKAKKLRAKSGQYFSVPKKTERITYEESKHGDLKTILDRIPSCTVCAIGSVFVSAVKLFDRVPLHAQPGEHIDDCISDDGGDLVGTLSSYFSYQQLRLMEACFERRSSYTYEDKWRTYNFLQGAERSATKRLVGIMKNIIRNNGTFVPDPDRLVTTPPLPEFSIY